MNEEKIVVFDMDGTIANLYGVVNWLQKLLAHDETPYIEAEPLVDMEKLNKLLTIMKGFGWKVVVTSWLANGSNKDYDKRVRQAKKQWLQAHGFPYDEIHLVKYGTTKADCTRKYGKNQILVDDNKKVLRGWHLGSTVDAKETDIITELIKIAIGA